MTDRSDYAPCDHCGRDYASARELANAATALADKIEQGDDCDVKISRQLADALVRVREAVLALPTAGQS